MTKDRKEKIKEIVIHYGTKAQRLKAIEELTELAEVLIKDINKREYHRAEILEEVADVHIMLLQLKEIYRFTDEELEKMIDSKIRRTMRRVKDEINLDNYISSFNHADKSDPTGDATDAMGDDRRVSHHDI